MSRKASITLAALALLAAGAAAWPFARPFWRERAVRGAKRPLSVLLVTLDTTRADRIGCYGRERAATPNLDALAARGVLFRQAYSHVPLTCPSHSSLLTGRLPTHHGVRDNGGYVLAPEIPTVAERFQAAGHRTGAFVSAFVLDRRFGLARGFATYHDRVPPGRAADQGDPSHRAVRAEETVGRALEWLSAEPARPFFLWVHLFDPHHPYEPPEPYAGRFRDDPYDGEIAYMDAQLGRLLDAAAARGALVAVMGDHGEGLGDHQEVTHSYFVYSNTQRVPFLLSLPGHLPAGAAVDGVVRGVDLSPTLLDLAGLPALPETDGTSLVPWLTGRRDGDAGPAYLESYHPRFWWGAQELLGLRSGRFLFIEAPRPELYDVAADPGEKTNLAASRPAELEALRARLRTFNAGGPPTAAGKVDAETARNLRALGYVGAGPAPAAGPLPDAKDNGPVLEAVTRGHELLERGQPAEALVQFEQALARNPRSASVRGRVAETLLRLGRNDDAFRVYAAAGDEHPTEEAFVGMAKARQAERRIDDAVALVRAGRAAFPTSTQMAVLESQLLLGRGDARGAEAAARAAVAIASGDEAARGALADALAAQKRTAEALEVRLALAEDSPQSNEARQGAAALAVWADEAMQASDFENARRRYAAVAATGAVNDALFLNLALALFRLDRKTDALATLERGRERFPESADLHYRAGRLLESAGRRAEAAAAYRRALAIAPGRADASASLARVGS
jgi:arylsulfatase A-like enzyme/predicted Zn-dependent protease